MLTGNGAYTWAQKIALPGVAAEDQRQSCNITERAQRQWARYTSMLHDGVQHPSVFSPSTPATRSMPLQPYPQHSLAPQMSLLMHHSPSIQHPTTHSSTLLARCVLTTTVR